MRLMPWATIQGTFNSKDIAIAAHYAYLLTDNLSAGITAKFVTSYISTYNSMAVGVDLGINYMNEDLGISVSGVIKNLGGQLKPFEDDYEKMPLNMMVGISKRFEGLPVRVHATLSDLNHTGYAFRKHLSIGTDVFFTSSTWLGVGYNFRKASEMSLGAGDEESSHGAGWSLGAGINLERIGVNVAWSKYHVSTSSLSLNVSYKL